MENRKYSNVCVTGFLVYKIIAEDLKTAKNSLKCSFINECIDLRKNKDFPKDKIKIVGNYLDIKL